MSKVIQVRDVPDDVHAVLTRRAAAGGLSLSGYVARELAALAGREENIDRLLGLATLPPQIERGSVAEIIREERDERESRVADHAGSLTHQRRSTWRLAYSQDLLRH